MKSVQITGGFQKNRNEVEIVYVYFKKIISYDSYFVRDYSDYFCDH